MSAKSIFYPFKIITAYPQVAYITLQNKCAGYSIIEKKFVHLRTRHQSPAIMSFGRVLRWVIWRLQSAYAVLPSCLLGRFFASVRGLLRGSTADVIIKIAKIVKNHVRSVYQNIPYIDLQFTVLGCYRQDNRPLI